MVKSKLIQSSRLIDYHYMMVKLEKCINNVENDKMWIPQHQSTKQNTFHKNKNMDEK